MTSSLFILFLLRGLLLVKLLISSSKSLHAMLILWLTAATGSTHGYLHFLHLHLQALPLHFALEHPHPTHIVIYLSFLYKQNTCIYIRHMIYTLLARFLLSLFFGFWNTFFRNAVWNFSSILHLHSYLSITCPTWV